MLGAWTRRSGHRAASITIRDLDTPLGELLVANGWSRGDDGRLTCWRCASKATWRRAVHLHRAGLAAPLLWCGFELRDAARWPGERRPDFALYRSLDEGKLPPLWHSEASCPNGPTSMVVAESPGELLVRARGLVGDVALGVLSFGRDTDGGDVGVGPGYVGYVEFSVAWVGLAMDAAA